MIIRPYDPARDEQAAIRMWREVGWLSNDETDTRTRADWFGVVRGLVGEVQGSPECLVVNAPGDVRYQEEDLPLCGVAGVSTGFVARKQGLAARVTAQAVARDAADGAMVAALQMFEQGYYNQVGFGAGAYEHRLRFDPAQLRVSVRHRAATRFSGEDWQAMHAARLVRQRAHGNVNLYAPEFTKADLGDHGGGNAFGLGYCDTPDVRPSHLLWINTSNMENGPYRVRWIAYRNNAEFLELMALLKSLGDQIFMVSMVEPGGIQFQDLLRQPFRQRSITDGSTFATGIKAQADWQMRICDLVGCLARTHLPGGTVRFNLRLSDPITRYLPDDAPWRGVGGEYVVTMGPESEARPGQQAGLPTLSASVNAFSRLWLGVQPASGLAVTDDLQADPALLAQLDRVVRLPSPRLDWDF
ncbi:MAG: GNAT family N-acetyltransferase [Anaerolineae bacterium]